MKSKRKTQLIFLGLFFVLVLGLFAADEVTAREIEPDPDPIPDYGDNAISNPKFESGSIGWIKSGGAGTVSSSTTTKYEGLRALSITGVVAVVGTTTTYANQDLATAEPIASTTVLSGAIYFDANTALRGAMIGVHITPADIYLWYYVSDTTDWSDKAGEYYTFDIGSSQDTWHKFHRDISDDLDDKDLETEGQSIDWISCHVRSLGIITNYCNGYFDDLYLGSTRPDVDIDSPSNNQWIRGTYTFDGNAVDHRKEGLSAVYYLRDPSAAKLLLAPFFWTQASGTHDWSVDIDTTGLSDGSHSFYVWVVDVFGTISYSDSISFNVDNTDPTINIASHSNNEYVKDTVTVSGTSYDASSGVNKVEYMIGDTSYSDATGTTDWEFDIDTTTLTDGDHTIYVRVTDNVGNTIVSSFVLKIDNSAPSIGSTTFTPPAGASGSTFTIYVSSISDGTGSGVNSATAYIIDPDSQSITIVLSKQADGRWKGTMPRDSDDLQGTYTLDKIVATDNLGTSKTKDLNLYVIYDRSKPTLSLTSHVNHDVISGTIVFSGLADDAYSGLNFGELFIDNQSVTINLEGGTWDFTLDTTDLQDGYHHFRVVVYDNVGYSQSIIFLLIIENDGVPAIPFIPVVDEYNEYITSCRVMIGDSQAVIALVIPESVSGTYARLLISEPYISMWEIDDLTYVEGGNTVSFLGWESSGSRYIQFPLVIGTSPGVDLGGRSIALALSKTQITWSVTSTDYDIEQYVTYQITVTASTDIGVPYGVPFEILVYALQENKVILIGTGILDDAGVANIDLLIGNNPELNPGEFSIFIKVTEICASIYDTTTYESSLFSGFAFFEQSNWSFNPASSDILHYTATVYDQRFVIVQVYLTDSTGSLEDMIGQCVEVHVTGPGTDLILTIYQTSHDDGVYALFSYNFTSAGVFQLEFDYIPVGYYLDLADHSKTVTLETQRPSSITLSSPSSCSVGVPIEIEATLTDDWASGFPIDGACVNLYYNDEGTWVLIGTDYTDGFGVARFSWMPEDSIWLRIAGTNLEFNATFSTSETHLGTSTGAFVSIDKSSTYFVVPFVDTTYLGAGNEVDFNIVLANQLGYYLEERIFVSIVTSSGTFAEFIVISGMNSSFTLTFHNRDTYTISLEFEGDDTYQTCSITETIEVYGNTVILSIQMDPQGNDIIAEEEISLSFSIQDLQGLPIGTVSIHVSIIWQDQEFTYELTNGVADQILFIPMKSGVMHITAYFEGDASYEPTSLSMDIDVLRRPVTVDISDIPDVVYPYIGPSFISYPITATVSDSQRSDALNGTSVILCHIFDNETVYQPIWNTTGYINSSLVQEYLAWGLFRIIGTGITDEFGIVSFTWEVETTSEQNFKVFALTLQNDVHVTGISSVFDMSFEKIPTSVYLETSWDGEGKTVSISTSISDAFDYQINGIPIQVYITSYLDPTNILYNVNVTSGFSNTFDWEAPEFGAYYVVVKFYGDNYYAESEEVQSTVVVSWRLIEIELDVPEAAFPGETIQMTARVIDLNGTENSPLLEVLTVYFAYFEDGVIIPIGQGDIGSTNMVDCIWTVPEDLTFYNVFTYTKRQIAYDAGRSDFHQISVRPFLTYLDIQVNSSVSWCLNFSYTFQVSLTDENGNSLVGEVVTLHLTDNYTAYWNTLGSEHSSSKFSLSCGNRWDYQVYELRVIIGYNDTFTWHLPGYLPERILFAQRAIAIGFYDGSSTHFATALTRKMSDFLIETDIDIIFDGDPRSMQAGVPQEIGVNVTNECGEILDRGEVLITITASNGDTYEFFIDLKYNSTFIWTPMKSDTYTINAEYTGGKHYRGEHWRNRGPGHHRGRHSRVFRYTRSYNVTGIVVFPESVDVIPNQLLHEYTTLDTILLGASIVSNLGLPLGGTSVTFYYLDSAGGLHFIGTSFTDSDGYAEVYWNLTGVFAELGYESMNILVAVDSHQFYRLTWMTDNLVKVWLEEEPEVMTSLLTSTFFAKSETGPDLVSPVALVTILGILSIPASILSRKNRRLLMLLAAILFIFCTTSMLYAGLAIESSHAPFADELIFDMSTNPSGPNMNPFYDLESARVQDSSLLFSNNPMAGGTITKASVLGTIQPGFSTSSPNATYVIVPLRNTFDINFTAYGYYVISILDENKNPVDTVSGYADGSVELSFLISDSKYSAGEQYTVNTFVTTQRYGITYGDNSWIVMNVARCRTITDLFIEPDVLQYTPDNHTISIATKLSQLRTNQSIADKEIALFYRSSLNLEWHDLATVVTDEHGLAYFEWDVSLPKDSYIINATFAGDDTFDGSMTLDMIQIDGSATQMGPAQYQPTRYSAQYSHPVNLYTQLQSHTGAALIDRPVDFILIQGEREHWFGSARTDSNGMANVTYMPYVDAGVYDFRVEFAGDNDFAASYYIFKEGLTVLKRNAEVTMTDAIKGYLDNPVEISAIFTDELGNPVRAENATLEIYDASSQLWRNLGFCETAPSGLASFEYIVDVSPGSYVYRITLQSTNTTARTARQGILTVMPHSTEIYFIPTHAEFGQNTGIMAHLQDIYGHALEDRTILYYINVNSKWVPIGSATTDSNGWARLSWMANYGKGVYQIKALYPGSDSESSVEYIDDGVTISKATSMLSMSISRKVQYTLPAQINLTLTDSAGIGLAHSPIELTISADGLGIVEEVTLYTKPDGSVSYSYVPPYLGSLTVEATFSGNTNYLGDSVSDTLVAEKMELAISLVVSQTSTHRGDILQFSGHASIIGVDDVIYPADEGISFVLMHSDGTPVNRLHYSIETVLNGVIVGFWEIPLGGSDVDILQAGDYTFKVVTPNNIGAEGETTFDLRLIETTFLTAAVERDGASIDKQHVDQTMNTRYILLDQDLTPMTNTELVFFIDDSMYLGFTDNSGNLLYSGFKPDAAGGFYSSVSYAGSQYFDSDFADVSLNVYRRSISLEFFETDDEFYTREDSMELSFEMIDSLTSDILLETINLEVFVDGGKIGEFSGHQGIDSILSILPDNLQAGPHEVSMKVQQNRIYEGISCSYSFYGYEKTKLILQVPETMKTNMENTIRVQLADIDGSPLVSKYVVVQIFAEDGSASSYNLLTDSFGEAYYEWKPTDEGSYDVEAWYGGTSLFEGTAQDETPYTTRDVVEGGGKTEAGNSPLFMLPLLLLSAVNIALEFLTFGCIAFLMAEAKLDDQILKIRRIAYPSIKIIKVTVNIWPFGPVEIPIPIPYLHSENDISLESESTTIQYSEAPDRDTEFKIKVAGMEDEDGIENMFEKFGNVLSGDSSDIKPTKGPSEDDYITPIRRSEPTDLNIVILSPAPGENFYRVLNVTARWTVDYPANAQDKGCLVNIDNGKFQPATSVGDPVLVEDGTISRVTYEETFDAMTNAGDIFDDNLSNGSHKVKIQAHADDITDNASTVFSIFNWAPVIFGFVCLLIGLFVAFGINYAIEKAIGKVVLQNEAIPLWLRAILATLTGVLGSILVFLIISLVLDLIGQVVGQNIWLTEFLGVPIGYIIAGFIFLISLICLVLALRSAYAPVSWKTKRLKVFGAIMGVGLSVFAFVELLLPPIMVLADENVGSGLPDIVEAIIEVVAAVLADGITTYALSRAVFGNYSTSGGEYDVKGKNPRTAYSMAQKFVTTLGVSMQMFYKTLTEQKHSQW